MNHRKRLKYHIMVLAVPNGHGHHGSTTISAVIAQSCAASGGERPPWHPPPPPTPPHVIFCAETSPSSLWRPSFPQSYGWHATTWALWPKGPLSSPWWRSPASSSPTSITSLKAKWVKERGQEGPVEMALHRKMLTMHCCKMMCFAGKCLCSLYGQSLHLLPVVSSEVPSVPEPSKWFWFTRVYVIRRSVVLLDIWH